MISYIENIKTLREKKGVSQQEMADLLGVTRQTYLGIEKGIRDISVGDLQKISDFFGVGIEQIVEGVIPNYDKYKQMILEYLKLQQSPTHNGKLPKTKLAKLLYFADFAYFYEHLESMSGMQYRRIQFGPVPDSYFRALAELEEQGYISVEESGEAKLVSITSAGRKTSLENLSSEEVNLMHKISEKWKNARTKEIVAFSHEQLPYKLCGDSEFIPYELITQEDPDHVY